MPQQSGMMHVRSRKQTLINKGKRIIDSKGVATVRMRHFLSIYYDNNRINHTVERLLFEPVFRIRMDQGFFADLDPGLKRPDLSINKLMGSK